MSQLLIPIDARPHSQRSVDLVRKFFNLKELQITLLHVVPELDPAALLKDTTGKLEDAYTATSESTTRELLDAVSLPLKQSGAKVDVQVEHGVPGATIKAFAESHRFPIIVTAPGQHSPQEQMLTGSITFHLLHFQYEGALVLARELEGSDDAPSVVFVIDGSAEINSALNLFAPLFLEKIPLILLSSRQGWNSARKATQPVENPGNSEPEETAANLEEAKDLLKQMKRSFHDVSIDKPFDTGINEFAEKEKPGILVLARSRHDALHRPIGRSQVESIFVESPFATALYFSKTAV